jgi:alpha-tubulin suppressor-like RCC1 family protein
MNLKRSFSSVARFSVFIGEDDSVYAWGDNGFDSLGLDQADTKTLPETITAPERVRYFTGKEIVSLGCGEFHSLAVTSDSDLHVWGSDTESQLGLDTPEQSICPPRILTLPDNEKPAVVACGAYFSVVVTHSGAVYSWGSNAFGQLGTGDNHARKTPTRVPGLPTIVDIVCGWFHVLAQSEEGEIYVWGRNEDGKLGLGHCSDLILPERIPDFHASRIYAGAHHSMALNTEGEFYVWGWNRYGTLGLADRNERHVPTPLPLSRFGVGKYKEADSEQPELGKYSDVLPPIIDAAGGWAFTLLLLEDGSVWSCGFNSYGQLGHSGTTDQLVPKKVNLNDERVVAIGAGEYFSFGLSEAGTLYVWGSRDLGIGMGPCNEVPQAVAGFKWRLPSPPLAEKWTNVFGWLFLGQLDAGSEFFGVPVEVLFHFTLLAKRNSF